MMNMMSCCKVWHSWATCILMYNNCLMKRDEGFGDDVVSKKLLICFIDDEVAITQSKPNYCQLVTNKYSSHPVLSCEHPALTQVYAVCWWSCWVDWTWVSHTVQHSTLTHHVEHRLGARAWTMQRFPFATIMKHLSIGDAEVWLMGNMKISHINTPKDFIGKFAKEGGLRWHPTDWESSFPNQLVIVTAIQTATRAKIAYLSSQIFLVMQLW